MNVLQNHTNIDTQFRVQRKNNKIRKNTHILEHYIIAIEKSVKQVGWSSRQDRHKNKIK